MVMLRFGFISFYGSQYQVLARRNIRPILLFPPGVNISHESRNYSVPDPKNFKTFPKLKKKNFEDRFQ